MNWIKVKIDYFSNTLEETKSKNNIAEKKR